MPRLWRRFERATKSDVQAAHAETLQRIADLRVELSSQLAPVSSHRASRTVIAAVIAVVSAAGSVVALSFSMSDTPVTSPAGTIGVAVLTDPSVPKDSWSVSSRFGGDEAAPSRFDLVVSSLDVAGGDSSTPPRVVLYFCGAIREGLALTELNDGPLDVQRLTTSAIESDSALGLRSDCDYTVSSFSNGWQTLVSGTSSRPYRSVAGSSVAYTAPRVTTLVMPEEVRGESVFPLAPDTRIDVALTDLPADLTAVSAAPQLPASGQPQWSFTPVTAMHQDGFRINGELGDLRNRAQMSLFLAGTLSGVAGAAALWCVEIAASRRGRPRGVRRRPFTRRENGLGR